MVEWLLSKITSRYVTQRILHTDRETGRQTGTTDRKPERVEWLLAGLPCPVLEWLKLAKYAAAGANWLVTLRISPVQWRGLRNGDCSL